MGKKEKNLAILIVQMYVQIVALKRSSQTMELKQLS